MFLACTCYTGKQSKQTQSMKHFFLMMLTAAFAITFVSCDNNDDSNPWVCTYPSEIGLFDETYTFDANGCCVLESAAPMSATDINSRVVGYGWMPVGTHEVKSNGKLSHDDYFKKMRGVGLTIYWFESSSQLTAYYDSDALPDLAYSRRAWSYDAGRGFAMQTYRDADLRKDEDRYMQIISVIDYKGNTYMYTVQKIYAGTTAEGGKAVFAMVVYQRMTDYELAKMKNDYKYDADADRSVPDNCKFKISVKYSDPDDGDTNPVFQTFRQMDLELVDEYGSGSASAPYYQYYDSIVWWSDCREMPDKVGMSQRKTDRLNTHYWWSTTFFTPHDNTTIYAYGYKDGHVVYQAQQRLYLVNDGFFGYDWSTVNINGVNNSADCCCLFDKNREFRLTKPTAYKKDISTPYAELQFVANGGKDKVNVEERLKLEYTALVKIMNQYYGEYQTIKNEEQRASMCKNFKTLPDDADMKMCWRTKAERMALVLYTDEKEPANSKYYVRAEPKK